MKDQLAALDDLYQNLRFTQKVHEKESYLSKLSSTLLKLINIGLISLILLLQFLQLRYVNRDYTNLSIIFAVIEVGIQAFQLSFNFETRHDQHRVAAKRAVELKNQLRVLKADAAQSKRITPQLIDRRDGIVEGINELYKSAPQTGFLARKLAEKK